VEKHQWAGETQAKSSASPHPSRPLPVTSQSEVTFGKSYPENHYCEIIGWSVTQAAKDRKEKLLPQSHHIMRSIEKFK